MDPQANIISDRENLEKEYVNKLNSIYIRPLKAIGFFRVETKDGQLVKTTSSNFWNGVISFTALNISMIYMFCYVIVRDDAQYKDPLALLILWILQNTSYICICIINRNTGIDLINDSIKIDALLGVNETKFMRQIAVRTFKSFILGMLMMFGASSFTFYWHLRTSWILILAAQVEILLSISYYEVSLGHALLVSLALRVRYLNVALIKLAKLNPTYFPGQFPFTAIFWKRKFDDLVKFHERADPKHFVKAFKIIFVQAHRVQKLFEFEICVWTMCMIGSAFLAVQTVIDYIIKPDGDLMQTATIVIIITLCLVIFFITALEQDFVYEQIQQTILICTYIQLKSSIPEKIINLAETIQNAIQCRNLRFSVYGMFYYDTNMIIKMTGLIMIYIVLQIQINISLK